MLYELKQLENTMYLARAGGGGSSSSSGSHSSSSSSRSSSSRSTSSGGSSSSAPLPWYSTVFIVFLSFGLPIIIIILILKFGSKTGASKAGLPAGYIDPEKVGNDVEKKLARRAREAFLSFQKSWSDFDLKSMQKITSAEYYKKMTLELHVLKNYARQNIMENVVIQSVFVLKAQDYTTGFSAFVTASAKDSLVDTKDNKTLFNDTSTFSEIWTFVLVGKKYVLSGITQTTADAGKFDPGIAEFATSNGFYYDTDFGWLMMPNRGAIFGPAGFGNADINNHVIGYYAPAKTKEKIVEFYSYEPKAGVGMQPFVVTQAILPRHYDDILVTEKSWYNFKPKAKGLTKIETESVEFNKKFTVWAANQDKATSFELLATNFMERIYALDFEINIEVVDNVLYLYSPSKNIAYNDMLEVLSWAFEEMKM